MKGCVFMISINNVSKAYGAFQALDQVSLQIGPGKIIGLLGRNGAGKTTLLRSIMGLLSYEGEIDIMGCDPKSERAKLMEHMTFISDVAILPKWMSVKQAMDFVNDIHPKFNYQKALDFINHTKIPLNKKIKALSKGMVTQVHLAIITAIDVKLLVLDEPTLGLDIITCKRFLSSLTNDFFNKDKTIIITTHQIEDISHILTDLIIIDGGKIMLNSPINKINLTSLKIKFDTKKLTEKIRSELESYKPDQVDKLVDTTEFIFIDKSKEDIKKISELAKKYKAKIMSPSLSDIFVCLVAGDAGDTGDSKGDNT